MAGKPAGKTTRNTRDQAARQPGLGLDGVRSVRRVGPDHLAFQCDDPSIGQFLTVDNWRTIAVQTVIVGIAALGMTMIMIAGGIDLSAGSTVALVTVCTAMFVQKVDPSLPDSLREMKLVLPLALLLGIAIGGLCGAINGGLIAGLRVVPFIVTLGTYTVYRGFATWMASSTQVYVPATSSRGGSIRS